MSRCTYKHSKCSVFVRKLLNLSYYMVFDVYSGFKGNAILKKNLKDALSYSGYNHMVRYGN